MKKLLCFVLCLVLATTVCVTLADETGHWYACTGCEEQQDFEPHGFDSPCDPDCNVCDYITDSAHTADTLWSSDETGHWHTCVDCGETMQVAHHTQGDDGLCRACGYALAHAVEEAHDWQKGGKTLSCFICGAEETVEVNDDSGSAGVIALTLLAIIVAVAVGLIIWLILYLKKKPGKYAR